MGELRRYNCSLCILGFVGQVRSFVGVEGTQTAPPGQVEVMVESRHDGAVLGTGLVLESCACACACACVEIDDGRVSVCLRTEAVEESTAE